jgi:hypothetical protein
MPKAASTVIAQLRGRPDIQDVDNTLIGEELILDMNADDNADG